jgi:hypothetical protein
VRLGSSVFSDDSCHNISQRESQHHDQGYQDDLRHGNLPEEQTEGDHLGILKKKDQEENDTDKYGNEFWFHLHASFQGL